MAMKERGEVSNGHPPGELSGWDLEPRPAALDRAVELELIDAALSGDAQAFADLFEHYRTDLQALCLQRLGDPSLAEDVVQGVFIKALASLAGSDHRKPMWPWLATIAYRMCVDLKRRRSMIHYSGDIGALVDSEANGKTTGSPLDEVIASEESAELWKSLDVLTPRQHRVFLSYALDGLSCAEIAAAEGISVGSVHLLLFRARKKMRSMYPNGRPLPAIVLPFTWLGWKLQRIEERIRPLVSVYGERFMNACVGTACLGALTMMVVVAGHPTEPFEGDAPIRFDDTVLPATSFLSSNQASPSAFKSDGNNPTNIDHESNETAARPTTSLVDDVIDPGQSASPENSSLHIIMTSPNYENDHTILAVGNYSSSQRFVWFSTSDGGANWRSRFWLPIFAHSNVVLAPGYPNDQRVFSLGDLGLLQSDDGGEIFRTASPLPGWSLGVSPVLRDGKFKVLIGAKTMFEYDADTGIVQPALPSIPWARGVYSAVIFSPSYRTDSTLFVSDNYYHDQVHYRCNGSICSEAGLPSPGPLTLKLSPRFDQDGMAYAYTPQRVLFSQDGARSFQDIPFPLPDRGSIRDMDIMWNVSPRPAIFAYVYVSNSNKSLGGVYRSFDGSSWSSSRIDVPNFEYGVDKLIVTPTGRLLALGQLYGIACSDDYGETWAPRCPPEL